MFPPKMPIFIHECATKDVKGVNKICFKIITKNVEDTDSEHQQGHQVVCALCSTIHLTYTRVCTQGLPQEFSQGVARFFRNEIFSGTRNKSKKKESKLKKKEQNSRKRVQNSRKRNKNSRKKVQIS